MTGLVASLLAVLGIVAVAVAISGQNPAPPAAPTGAGAAPVPSSPEPSSSTRDPSPDPMDRTQGDPSDLVYSRPTRIRIHAIDVDSSLVTVGLDGGGVMETPEPVDKAGWFEPSPPPGIPGATVISGHVTWNQEPMVFFRLGDLTRGDRVEVTRKDGATTVFVVTRIGSFSKESFPTDAVYGQPSRSELRLITCGGEYDESTNRYLDNVIVWAKIVDIKNAPA